MPRSGIKYAGGVLWALTGGCYRGASAPLGLSVTHSSTVPWRGSLRPLAVSVILIFVGATAAYLLLYICVVALVIARLVCRSKPRHYL